MSEPNRKDTQYIIPTGLKPGDECPFCADTNHTGVWAGGHILVCMVCGDRGCIDETSFYMYGSVDKSV